MLTLSHQTIDQIPLCKGFAARTSAYRDFAGASHRSPPSSSPWSCPPSDPSSADVFNIKHAAMRCRAYTLVTSPVPRPFLRDRWSYGTYVHGVSLPPAVVSIVADLLNTVKPDLHGLNIRVGVTWILMMHRWERVAHITLVLLRFF